MAKKKIEKSSTSESGIIIPDASDLNAMATVNAEVKKTGRLSSQSMEAARYPGAKNTIKQIVEGYKLLYPDEYAAVVKYIADKRHLLLDEKYGSVGSNAGTQGLQRGLFEIPSLIHDSIIDLLTEEQLLWFKTGTDANPNEGGIWFAKTFPEFRIAEQI